MNFKSILSLMLGIVCVSSVLCESSPFDGCTMSENLIECQSHIEEFPKRTQEEFTDKYEMTLSSSSIRLVPNDRFNGLSLYSLFLENNKIEEIAENAFAGASIDTIYLNENSLGELPANVFQPIADSLETLKLTANKLGNMETSELSKVFLNLVNLNDLDLMTNDLKRSPNLSTNTRLKKLNLKNNRIDSLEKDIFAESLTELNLDDNNLHTLHESWFSNLKHLTYLSLSNNQISSIDENVFHKLTNLVKLNLARNKFKLIPSKVLHPLRHLVDLTLTSQYNFEHRLDDFSFDKINPSYEVIHFHNNLVKDVSKQAFCSVSENKQKSVYAKHLYLRLASFNKNNICVLTQLNGTNQLTHKSKPKTEITFDFQHSTECDCSLAVLNHFFNVHGSCSVFGNSISIKNYKCEDVNIDPLTYCRDGEDPDEYSCVKEDEEQETTKVIATQKPTDEKTQAAATSTTNYRTTARTASETPKKAPVSGSSIIKHSTIVLIPLQFIFSRLF